MGEQDQLDDMAGQWLRDDYTRRLARDAASKEERAWKAFISACRTSECPDVREAITAWNAAKGLAITFGVDPKPRWGGDRG